MSSTGVISRVLISPTTSISEARRQSDNAIAALPGTHEQIRRTVGTIIKLHPQKPRLVKAKSDDGSPLANGSWIELNHSAQEIVERWGMIRVGFKVRVTSSGPSGAGTDATIIGTELTNVAEPPQSNEAERGLFAIFAPGIGIG